MYTIVAPGLRRALTKHHSYRPLLSQAQSALYHSHQHAPPPSPYNSAESSILSAALEHVPEHGFSNTALTMGARDAGYLDISVNLFPRGAFELARYHLVKERLGLHERVGFGPGKVAESVAHGEQGVGRKIRTLCVERLRANENIIGRWQEALALMAMPSNVPPSVAELASLADEMWYLAGDKSVDTSWYTKRASLSAVYASTEVFMTKDQSPGFRDTWDFLDRRLKEVNFLGKAVSEVGDYVGFTAHAVMNILRSKSIIR